MVEIAKSGWLKQLKLMDIWLKQLAKLIKIANLMKAIYWQLKYMKKY